MGEFFYLLGLYLKNRKYLKENPIVADWCPHCGRKCAYWNAASLNPPAPSCKDKTPVT